MSYLGRSAKLSLKAQEKVSFLATAGQTSKTGLSYVPSFVEVYVNGVLLTDNSDYTATNGNSITFTVALLLNDEVTVISLKTFTVADHYSKTEADTLLAAKSPLASPVLTGNVGINETSPAANLHLGASSPHIDIGPSGANRGKIGFNSNNVYIGSTSGAGEIHFKNNISSNDAPNSSGDTKMIIADSAVIIGNGVTLGNGNTYAAANTLDDYEEGSGTPVVKYGTTTMSLHNGALARYVKIGSSVTYLFEFRISNTNSGGGDYTLALPFAMMDGGYAVGGLRIYNGAVAGGEFLGLHQNQSNLRFNRNRNNTSVTSITPTLNAYYYGSITYRTS